MIRGAGDNLRCCWGGGNHMVALNFWKINQSILNMKGVSLFYSCGQWIWEYEKFCCFSSLLTSLFKFKFDKDQTFFALHSPHDLMPLSKLCPYHNFSPPWVSLSYFCVQMAPFNSFFPSPTSFTVPLNHLLLGVFPTVPLSHLIHKVEL